MMMNENSAAEDFGNHHVRPIEKLAVASGEREIKRRPAAFEAPRNVSKRLKQLSYSTQHDVVRAGCPVENPHRRFSRQKLQHMGTYV